jgi:hypothetical protein
MRRSFARMVSLVASATFAMHAFGAEPEATVEREEKPVQESAEPQRTSSASRTDRLELDTTVVTGNRELPKVLYIVPWKKADIGELPGQPFNTLLDEVLTPVDRDVFRREVTYYEAVTSGGGDSAVPAVPSGRGAEK